MSLGERGQPHENSNIENDSQRQEIADLWQQIEPKMTKVILGWLKKYKDFLTKHHPGLQVDDLKHEAYEKMMESYKKWNKQDSFENYFFTVINNHFIDTYLRSVAREDTALRKLDLVHSDLYDYGKVSESPDNQIIIEEIKNELMNLSLSQALVLVLHYGLGEFWIKKLKFKAQDSKVKFGGEPVVAVIAKLDNYRSVDFSQGLNFREISLILGVNENTVYTAAKRAIAKIRNKLNI